jgi:hypothetical protein
VRTTLSKHYLVPQPTGFTKNRFKDGIAPRKSEYHAFNTFFWQRSEIRFTTCKSVMK